MSMHAHTPTVGEGVADAPRHRDRGSVAWWLKPIAIAPLVLTAFLVFAFGLVAVFLYGAPGLAWFVPSLLFAGLVLVAWRRPGLAGGLLIVIAPLGAFVLLLGTTNLTPTGVLIGILMWFAGMLVAAAMLIAAAVWPRPRA